MRVEVLGGVERRRRWSRDEKMRILAESLEPGAKVAEVARRNDVAPSLAAAGAASGGFHDDGAGDVDGPHAPGYGECGGLKPARSESVR